MTELSTRIEGFNRPRHSPNKGGGLLPLFRMATVKSLWETTILGQNVNAVFFYLGWSLRDSR
jgi:hypothetical protein